MIDPQLPGNWKEWEASFTAGNFTFAKILCDVTPAVVANSVASETALPGEATVRQRIRTGGQRIFDGYIASTDGTARSVNIYVGTQLTKQADAGTFSCNTSAISRTSGSFLTDGYQVGDAVMAFNATSANNNGQVAIVTAANSTVLTLNGTPLVTETFPAGSRLFRVTLRTRRGIPINAGNADATPPVQLLGGTQEPAAFSSPDTGLSLSDAGALIIGPTSNVSALPAQLMCHAVSAVY